MVPGPGARTAARLLRLVAADRDLGQVLVVLGVVPASRLVGHQHLGRFVGAVPHRLQLDVLGDVPSPVRTVRAQRTLEGLLVQVADDVHVEPGGGRRPERAVRTLEHPLVLGYRYVGAVGGYLFGGDRRVVDAAAVADRQEILADLVTVLAAVVFRRQGVGAVPYRGVLDGVVHVHVLRVVRLNVHGGFDVVPHEHLVLAHIFVDVQLARFGGVVYVVGGGREGLDVFGAAEQVVVQVGAGLASLSAELTTCRTNVMYWHYVWYFFQFLSARLLVFDVFGEATALVSARVTN